MGIGRQIDLLRMAVEAGVCHSDFRISLELKTKKALEMI